MKPMLSESTVASGARPHTKRPRVSRAAHSGRSRCFALLLFAAVPLAACIPIDTGGNAGAMALQEVENIAYYMREETALLQAQLDSLRMQQRKTDSLLRWVANLTGNPIPEPIIPPPGVGGTIVIPPN